MYDSVRRKIFKYTACILNEFDRFLFNFCGVKLIGIALSMNNYNRVTVYGRLFSVFIFVQNCSRYNGYFQIVFGIYTHIKLNLFIPIVLVQYAQRSCTKAPYRCLFKLLHFAQNLSFPAYRQLSV